MIFIKTSSLPADHDHHHLQAHDKQDKRKDQSSQVMIKHQHYILTSAWTSSTI